MEFRDSKRQRILYYEVPDETRFRSPPDASACTIASLDDEVPPFLQNLLFKDPQSFHGHTFYLLEGGAWDDSSEAQLLFVRQCHPKMFNFVNGLVKNHDLGRTGAPKRAVVSGTAGIGKSLFGLYAARKWFDADISWSLSGLAGNIGHFRKRSHTLSFKKRRWERKRSGFAPDPKKKSRDRAKSFRRS